MISFRNIQEFWCKFMSKHLTVYDDMNPWVSKHNLDEMLSTRLFILEQFKINY